MGNECDIGRYPGPLASLLLLLLLLVPRPTMEGAAEGSGNRRLYLLGLQLREAAPVVRAQSGHQAILASTGACTADVLGKGLSCESFSPY